MSAHHLDPELKRRLELVARPEYEKATLTKSDHLLLFIAGIIVPFILMIWGWIQ